MNKTFYPTVPSSRQPRFLVWTTLRTNPRQWLVGVFWRWRVDGSGRFEHALLIDVDFLCCGVSWLIHFGKRKPRPPVDPVRSFSAIMGYRTVREHDDGQEDDE
jgi:hypothetical protein